MNRKGITLIELMASLGIFSLVALGIFMTFAQSTRSFQHALLKQGLQGDSIKFGTLLSRDVRLTNYHSNEVVPRSYNTSGGAVVQRDGLAVAALSDWEDGSKFDAVTGLPLWDRYRVYYATNDQDSGRLIRQVVDPGGPTNGAPYFALNANMRNAPELNNGVSTSLVISESVESLTAEVDDGSESINVTLVLRRKGGIRRSSGGVKTDEVLEVRYSLTAKNTFPKL